MEYYDTMSVPEVAVEHAEKAGRFLKEQERCKIALVTSGGTSATIDREEGLSLENFSTGRRGSELAERLLDREYRVIFLHRGGSPLPFLRSHNLEGCDFVNTLECCVQPISGDVILRAKDESGRKLLQKYKDVIGAGRLLVLRYATIHDYLFSVKALLELLSPRGRDAVLVFAAAVSDFYISTATGRVEAVSQNSGRLISLDPVPKILPYLFAKLEISAFIVMFKLVTNVCSLDGAARKILESSRANAVVGNVLDSRYSCAYYFSGRCPADRPTIFSSSSSSAEPLSYQLADAIDEDHSIYMNHAGDTSTGARA